MAEKGLAPLSALGREAVAARIAQKALAQGELAYFHPVAALPGFARALARTLVELRLARVSPEQLASAGTPTGDLATLLDLYQAELAERSLVDLPGLLALATEAVDKRDSSLGRVASGPLGCRPGIAGSPGVFRKPGSAGA